MKLPCKTHQQKLKHSPQWQSSSVQWSESQEVIPNQHPSRAGRIIFPALRDACMMRFEACRWIWLNFSLQKKTTKAKTEYTAPARCCPARCLPSKSSTKMSEIRSLTKEPKKWLTFLAWLLFKNSLAWGQRANTKGNSELLIYNIQNCRRE